MHIAAFETQTKDECDTMARELISQAVARCAADHSSEATVSVVPLPSEK
jgi:ribonuclease Y